MANNDNEIPYLKRTRDGEWALISVSNGRFCILHAEKDGKADVAYTPGGTPIVTCYESLAYRLIDDIEQYGIDCYSPESIIPWHFTMLDSFMKMEHEEVEDILARSFLQIGDWTLDDDIQDEQWHVLFGDAKSRKKEIQEWLSKCTHMQMTAVCCIGNANRSINLAYVLAQYMENYKGRQLEQQLAKLASKAGQYSPFNDEEDLIVDFNTFKFYYGIHLEENGAIINKTLPNETIDFTGKQVSEKALIGRNYKHYIDYEESSEEAIHLNVPDLPLDLDDESEDDDESDDYDEQYDYDEYSELGEYISDDCWIKRINASTDGHEAYYILVVEVTEGAINNAYVIEEEVIRIGQGFFTIPGMEMPGESTYSKLDYIPDECETELSRLIAGRYITEGFSFIGKTLPGEMIEEGGNGGSDTEYTCACQSAYRQAYMHMIITTSEDGIIQDFDYSTFQSSGSAFGDMFSRPICISDRADEALDMLLYLLDKYTDDEL